MTRWIPVAGARELAPGTGKHIEIGEAVIALFHHAGGFYALAGACPHQGGPLGHGRVDPAGVVTCPWHSWQFRIQDGRSPLSPALCVRTYPVRVADGRIEVDLDAGPTAREAHGHESTAGDR